MSIAIFAAGAALTLTALQSALDGVRRAELRARAEDLAASRLAELDAGLVSIGDLRDSGDGDGGDAARLGDDDALSVTIEILPAPGAARGSALSLARATVRAQSDVAAGSDGAVLAVAERVVRTKDGAQ